MSRLARAFALIGVVTGVLAGSVDVARAEPELEGTFWKLDRVGHAGAQQIDVIVQISDGSIALSAPCRGGEHRFEYGDSGFVRFHPGAGKTVTTAGAPCAAALVWGTIGTSLARAKRYQLNGNALILFDRNGRRVVALSRIAAIGLENRKWAIAEYWDGKALVSAQRSAYIVLMHGRADGSPGCGGLWGLYSLFGQRVTLRVSAVLAGLCDRWAQMERVGDALNGDRLVEHEPHRTVLRDSRGGVRVVLRPY